MSAASLKTFLQNLHEEMKTTSDEYRTATGDKKTTTLVYRSLAIRKTLNELMENNVTKSGKAAAINMNEETKAKVDAEIVALTKDLRKMFKEFKLPKGASKKDGKYTDIHGGFMFTLIHTDDGRDNFKTIKNQYKDRLEAFYSAFLAIIKRKKGLRRKSGRSDEIRIVDKAHKAFNQTHESGEGAEAENSGSNYEGYANDAIFAAIEETWKGSTKMPPAQQAQLKKALGKDADIIFSIMKDATLGTVTVGIDNALTNFKEGGKEQKRVSKALEAALLKLGVADLKGSDSLAQGHRKKIIKELVKPFKNRKDVKVVHESTQIDKASSTTNRARKGKNSITKSTAGALFAKKGSRRTSSRKPAQPKMALQNILGLINAKLPQQVAENMGSPRLENRSGRFAQSVRATDVTNTAKGFKSVGYTYRKDPYQVYESGSGTRFSDVQRDPRVLIDVSIREIVASFGLGRLYTRRQ
tara:strand:- start:54 stop:1460 length:1407 start_codon:yes stop_codon:yes gene_type:complete